MNRLSRFLFFLLLIALWLIPAPLARADEPRLQSVQAEFTQEKHLKLLARPLISKGIFIFQASQSLRWEYRTPLHSLLLMHEGTLRKFVEHEGRLVSDHGTGMDALPVLLNNIGDWIDGRFTDNALFRVIRTGKKTVLLQPREEGMQTVINRIELVLGREAGIVETVTIVEGPDTFTRLTFHDAILNREIPRETFTGP